MPKSPLNPKLQPLPNVAKIVRRCKRAGITAADLWTETQKNIRESASKGHWRPSETAMTITEWKIAIESVYKVEL